jgi:hypothetical protein
MPNWTNNCLSVEGNEQEVQGFINKVTTEGNDTYSILNTLLPTPTELYEGDDWYDWNVSNWGTKWQDSDTTLVIRDTNYVFFRFDTAWAPPLVGFESISVMFPELTFVLTYQEMGMGFVGCAGYLNGAQAHVEREDISIPEETEDNDLMDVMYSTYSDLADECEAEVRQEMNIPSPLAKTL